MITFTLALAWLAALVIFVLVFPRLAWLVVAGLIVYAVAGCATVDPDQAEYDRVEWVETVFKREVRACEQAGGYITYVGPYSQRIRRILDEEDWSQVQRTEYLNFVCQRR